MVQLHLLQVSLSTFKSFSQIFGFQFFQFIHFHGLSVFIVITSNNKLCLHGKFLCSQAQSFFGNFKTYTFYFKEYATGSNRCYPSCRVTLTFTHTYISRFASDGFIREDTNPDLTFTVHATVDSHTCSFNLPTVNPFRFQRFDAERTKSQLCASVSVAFIATSVLRSSIFYSFGL